MKFSIITVTKNSSKTILRTVKSVASQSLVAVEHVIKDAGSVDETIELAKSANPFLLIVNKPDNGIYDAMNQGFSASSGEIIAFLNSDDYYIDDNVLSDILFVFKKFQCDFVYGDIAMVSSKGSLVRCWRADDVDRKGLIVRQIPHPGLFIKREVLLGLDSPFDSSYRISADLKQQLIISKLKLNGKYINRSLVIMETGGASTNSFKSFFLGWQESVRAYNEVYGTGGLWFVVKKVFSKFKGLRVFAQLRDF